MAETNTAAGASDQPTAEVKSEAKPQRKRITRRKAVEEKLRAYCEAMDNRDADGMAAHWSKDGVEDIVPVGVLRGRERLVAGEQSCAVEWRLEGTLNGAPFLGIEPTGKHVEVRGLDLFELENGDLVSNTAYFDGMGFARQIGLLPPDGSGADRAMRSAFNAVTKLRRALAERRGA